MRRLYRFGIVMGSVAILTFALAVADDDKSGQLAYQKFLVIPQNAIDEHPDLRMVDIAKMAKTVYPIKKGILVLKPLEEKAYYKASLYRAESGSFETYVAYCYRCALGQVAGDANKDFCLANFGFWDQSKEDAKSKCK